MGYVAIPSPTDPDQVEITGTGDHVGLTATVTLNPDKHGLDRLMQLTERFQAAWAGRQS